MKTKLTIVILALALLLGGCQTISPVTQTVQDEVCKAPQEVIAVADLVLNLLKPLVGSLVPGTGPYIALVTAQGIKDTGCAALTGLNTMITFIEGINTERALKTRAVKMAPLGIDVQVLKNWRDRK